MCRRAQPVQSRIVSLTRRDLGRLAAGGAIRPDAPAKAAWTSVDVGLTAPDSFGDPGLSCAEIARRSASLGIRTLELDIAPVEAWLGAPAEPAALHPPAMTFEMGLLPGEEEVYDEPVRLARRTFAADVRAWRRRVSLAPLDDLRRQLTAAGIRVAALKWAGLGQLPGDDVEYACRVARQLGAAVVSTNLTHGGPARVRSTAERHGVAVAWSGAESTSPADLEAVFEHGPLAGAAIDVGDWRTNGYASLVPFLERHAAGVRLVRLSDRRESDGALARFGEGDAAIGAVLRARRDGRWPCLAVIDIRYDLPTAEAQHGEIARALTVCRAALTGGAPLS